MKVYPWRTTEYDADRRAAMRFVRPIGKWLRYISAIASFGLTLIPRFFAIRGFARVNDSWAKRGLILVAIGLLGLVFIGDIRHYPQAWLDLLYSFGSKATVPADEAALNVVTLTIRTLLPIALILQGFASMIESRNTDIAGERFIARTKPTLRLKARRRRNTKALREQHNAGSPSLAFGVIVDDPIPWRTPRYGMISARLIDRLGHGCIAGGNGTGKTYLSLNLIAQAAQSGMGVFNIDFKNSISTRDGAARAAATAGVPFYSFDLARPSETSWYEPLGWAGTASEKTSMLIESFNFSSTGDSAYYRGRAEAYLVIQFELLEYMGLDPDESTFEFLQRTVTKAGFRERLERLRGSSNPHDRDVFTRFSDRTAGFADKDLAGLASNLATVVNIGGKRLRPQQGVPPISLAKVAANGGVVYFGLSTTNEIALKVFGTLILKDLNNLANTRMHNSNKDALRPVLTLVDEASRLGERASVMNDLFALMREANMWLWTVTQSFSTWPTSTIIEMKSNILTMITFRVQDSHTAAEITRLFQEVPAFREMSEKKTDIRAFQGDIIERSGEAKGYLESAPFLVDATAVESLPNYHCYVYCTGSQTRPTLEEWRSRRLPKPDQIKTDAPLVYVVPMELTEVLDQDSTQPSEAAGPAGAAAEQLPATGVDYSPEVLPFSQAPRNPNAPVAPRVTSPRTAAQPEGRGLMDEPPPPFPEDESPFREFDQAEDPEPRAGGGDCMDAEWSPFADIDAPTEAEQQVPQEPKSQPVMPPGRDAISADPATVATPPRRPIQQERPSPQPGSLPTRPASLPPEREGDWMQQW